MEEIEEIEQYYMKVLPDHCIPFESEEGKAKFKEALLAGYMERYFGLASQFCTQEEPAYCALTTLVMVLNTLRVDPNRMWKGVWRWYDEGMVNCSVPLEEVMERGLTFAEFGSIAECNSLDVEMHSAGPTSSINHFRKMVKETCRGRNKILVASYYRPDVDQAGEGHFSPVAGYHASTDMVLILDTARFKYPPHWMSLSMLFTAMQSLDEETGKPRGYCLLSKKKETPNSKQQNTPNIYPRHDKIRIDKSTHICLDISHCNSWLVLCQFAVKQLFGLIQKIHDFPSCVLRWAELLPQSVSDS